MADEYKTFLHRWFEEVWNQKSEAAIDELFDADGIANGLSDAEGNPLRGPEGFKTLHRAFLSAYPDLKITVEDTLVEGDKISARCTIRGTHSGEGLGVAATNQPVEFTGLCIVKLRDGKIVEAWNEFDFIKMYSQVGALTFNLRTAGEEYETIAHRWFNEVWNKKREDAIDEMISDDTVHHGLGGTENTNFAGIENFKNFHRKFLSIFPDLQITVEDVIEKGEKIAIRYTVCGTHTGEGLGIPPTNQKVEFTGSGIGIVRDGKFVEVWNEVDFMKMYSQIGALTLNLQ
jgi:predicted ester cyclase